MAKYKVGDRVRVKSKEWWDEQQKNGLDAVPCIDTVFSKNMIQYCGLEAKIIFLDKNSYAIDIDNGKHCWNDEMLEDIPTTEQSTLYNDLANAINKVVSEHRQTVMVEEIEGGIIIKPIEEKEEDLPIGTQVACSNNTLYWEICVYKGNNTVSARIDGNNYCESRKYIIPLNLFSNDIEESLKHNIVK